MAKIMSKDDIKLLIAEAKKATNYSVIDNPEQLDVPINPHTLDENWLEQPVYVDRYAMLLSQKGRVRDKLKEKLELLKAQIAMDIRDEPKRYVNYDRVTEAAIQEVLLVDSRVQDLQEALGDLNAECNVYFNKLKSLEHRKKSLEWLSDLWKAGYWQMDSDSLGHKTAPGIRTYEEAQRIKRANITNAVRAGIKDKKK